VTLLDPRNVSSDTTLRTAHDLPHVDGVSELILADPHPVTLAGLAHVVQSAGDLRVVAECTSAEEAVEAIGRYPAATLVVDLHLPPGGALALLRRLAATPRPSLPIVLLASRISDEDTLEALRAGIRGLALKEMESRLVIECIRSVSRGDTWIENAALTAMVERAVRGETQRPALRRRLTRRETHVLSLVAQGLSNKEITRQLRIAEGTVKIHLHNIYRKVGVEDRLQLTQYAKQTV